MKINDRTIKESMHGLTGVFFADRKLVKPQHNRHLRGGKLTKQDCNRENRHLIGTPVHALGTDELGNLIYLGTDGILRQAY